MSCVALESYVDLGIQLAKERGYYPVRFVQLRKEYQTVEAMRRLVETGELQAGLLKCVELGLLPYSVEETVLKFPQCFKKRTVECAEFRLNLLKKSGKIRARAGS